jgi:hypothetical protein
MALSRYAIALFLTLRDFVAVGTRLGVAFVAHSFEEVKNGRRLPYYSRRKHNVFERVQALLVRTCRVLRAGCLGARVNWQKSSPKERARFLKLIVSGLVAALLSKLAPNMSSWFSTSQYPPPWPHPERRGMNMKFKRDPRCEPFEKFKYPKRILFLVTGAEGKAVAESIIETLSQDPRFNFYDHQGPVWLGNYTVNSEQADIMIIDVSQVGYSDMQNFNNTPCNLIFVRGHTDEMQKPMRFAANNGLEAEYCLTVLGGCNSAHFINNLHTPKSPVAGIDGIAYTIRNNALAKAIIDCLHSPHVNSWQEFSSEINRALPRSAASLVMPGSNNYEHWVRGEYNNPAR